MPRARVPLAALVAAVCLGVLVTLLIVFAAGGFDSGEAQSAATVPAVDPTEQPLVGAGRRTELVGALRGAEQGRRHRVSSTSAAETSQSSGAGFVADASRGLIITNSHVVTNSDRATDPRQVQPYGPIYVQRADGSRVLASIVGYDLFDDIAILRYDPNRLPMPAVPMGDSTTVRVGDPVAAIGAPFGTPSRSRRASSRRSARRSSRRPPSASSRPTRSRPTRRSTPETRAGRCSTRRAR